MVNCSTAVRFRLKENKSRSLRAFSVRLTRGMDNNCIFWPKLTNSLMSDIVCGRAKIK